MTTYLYHSFNGLVRNKTRLEKETPKEIEKNKECIKSLKKQLKRKYVRKTSKQDNSLGFKA